MTPTSQRLDGKTKAGLTIGFIPLVDCATLIVAHEKGFAAAEGLELTLVREVSWANIRDKVAFGHFDAAHMLGPMPIASSLGVGRPAVPMIAPFALGLGGNAITLAPHLYAAMRAALDTLGEQSPDPLQPVGATDPGRMGWAFAQTLAQMRQEGAKVPTLAVVHPFSGHNYELRYWLAAAGIDPDRDLRLTVVPPSMMVAAMQQRQIDGFCAGEPWNSLCVEAGAGVIVVTKAALWRQGPEKVLGLRQDVADADPDRLAALLRALHAAAAWAGRSDNHAEIAVLLAQPAYVGAPATIITRALQGSIVRRPGGSVEPSPDFLLLHQHAANFPWISHALWFYAQMVRWGHVDHNAHNAALARQAYRPDLYRQALRGTSADLPRADAKVEGALQRLTPVASRHGTMLLGPDGFFDGRIFDPDALDAYLEGFSTRP